MISIHAYLLVALCIAPALALFHAWRKYDNLYALTGLIMTIIFALTYVYLGFFDPPIETARIIARPAFVVMWGLASGVSLWYIAAIIRGHRK